jgi:hypothetical protein
LIESAKVAIGTVDGLNRTRGSSFVAKIGVAGVCGHANGNILAHCKTALNSTVIGGTIVVVVAVNLLNRATGAWGANSRGTRIRIGRR